MMGEGWVWGQAGKVSRQRKRGQQRPEGPREREGLGIKKQLRRSEQLECMGNRGFRGFPEEWEGAASHHMAALGRNWAQEPTRKGRG